MLRRSRVQAAQTLPSVRWNIVYLPLKSLCPAQFPLHQDTAIPSTPRFWVTCEGGPAFSRILSRLPSGLSLGACLAAGIFVFTGVRDVRCDDVSGLSLCDPDRKRSCRRTSSIRQARGARRNGKHQPDDCDYDKFPLVFGCEDDYDVRRPLGKGAHGEVFEGIRTHNASSIAPTASGDLCVIKKLKSAKERMIRREVQILHNLRDGPNIIALLDVVQGPRSKEASLIFEHGDFVELKSVSKMLSDEEVRFYIFEILRALEYCHSQGIMHRDVKPRNVVVNLETKQIRLIDFGLAEFFQPGKGFSLRVSSLRYKAPELLVGQIRYDYSVDIWSLGCMLADIVFKKDPFFRGKDSTDQLARIVNVLGTDDLFPYLRKHSLQLDYHFSSHLRRQPRRSLFHFVTDENCDLAVPQVIDLLDKMLVYDPAFRLSPREAMEHPYFRSVRARHTADSDPRSCL